MALPKQKYREIVFQLLYSLDFFDSNEADLISLVMKQNKVSKKNISDALVQVKIIQKKLTQIDELISEVSSAYKIERIAKVELNVLRLGIYELLYDDAIPQKVAISEAIRLSRKYGTRESAKFVNGILDYLYKKELGKEESNAEISKE